MTITSYDGASISGQWTPHGYTAGWSMMGVYDEFLFDYDDTTVQKLVELEGNFSSIVGWETSLAGGKGGVAISGAGEWFVGNATSSHVMLQKMSEYLGKELTGDACNEKYREVWREANNGNDTSDTAKFNFLKLYCSLSMVLFFLL